MDYKFSPTVCIGAMVLLLVHVSGQRNVGYNLFPASTPTEIALNDNLKERISAYYQPMQSFPRQITATNLRNHQGYNYITPASTYTGYSTSTHKTQTAPLAVSLHPDDYTKFDKTDQTFFLAKAKPATPKALSDLQPSFYIPRGQIKQNQANAVQSAIEVEEQIQNESDLKPSSADTQQQWKPLLNAVKSLSKPPKKAPYSLETVQTSAGTSGGPNPNNLKGSVGKLNQSFNQELPVVCQEPSTNFQGQETSLRSSQLEGQSFDQASSQQHQRAPLTSSSSNSARLQTVGSLNALNQRRLNIIRSLLAEYIALTQPNNVPGGNQGTQPYVKYDETPESFGDNDYSADSQFTQFQPAHSPSRLESPAENKFSNSDHSQKQQFFQMNTFAPEVRQPHAVYGAPFVDNFNPALN